MTRTANIFAIMLALVCTRLFAAPAPLFQLPGELKAASDGQVAVRTTTTVGLGPPTASAITVFDLNTGTPTFQFASQQALSAVPGAANDSFWQQTVHAGFGTSVAFSGSHLFVGSPGSAFFCDCITDPPAEQIGRYGNVFEFNSTTGTLEHRLTSPSMNVVPQPLAYSSAFYEWIGFGGKLAADDSSVVIGRRGFDVSTAAQLFELPRLTDEERRFTNSMGTFFNEDFEGPAAISGNTVLESRVRNRETFHGDVGLYDLQTNQLKLILAPGTGQPEDRFGASIAINGNLALIGAPADVLGSNRGRAYLYDLETGQQLFKFSGDPAFVGPNGRDNFGISVALAGNLALIASPGDSQFGPYGGAAYLFDATTGSLLAKILPDSPSGQENFGSHVALTRSFALVESYVYTNASPMATTHVYALAIPEPSSLLLLLIASAVTATAPPRGRLVPPSPQSMLAA
jgi:hypothetical protein